MQPDYTKAIEPFAVVDAPCADLLTVQSFGPFARLIFGTIEQEFEGKSAQWVVCQKILLPTSVLVPIGHRLLKPPVPLVLHPLGAANHNGLGTVQ